MTIPPAAAADTWSAPTDLSATGQAADSVQVAAQGSTVIGIWRRSNGTNQVVQATRSTDGGQTWSAPVDLSATGRDAASPQVAMAGSTAVVTWRRSNGASQVVQATRSADGGQTWSTPVDLSASGQDASLPQVAISGSTAIVTWYRSNGTSQVVQAASSTDGGITWGAPSDLSATGRDALSPTVAISGTTAVVTWYRSNGTNTIAQAARSGDGGMTWSAAMDVSAAGGDAVYPVAAVSSSTAVIVWRRFNGANTIVQASRSTDGGQSWSTPTDLSATGQGAISPRVAITGSTAVAIWRRSDGTNFIAQSARSTDGGATWSTPIDLSTPGRDVTAPQVAFNGSAAVGTWYRSNGTNMIVQAVRSTDAGVSWSTLADLSAPGQNAFYPQVALSSSTAIVIWYRSNGSHYIAQAATIAIPAHGGADAAAQSIFRFVLPDGRECTSISPQVVENGSAYVLPGDGADCRTPGAVITGWRIPGQDWAFRPDHTVIVVDSQVFTVILREPVVHITLDANVDDVDGCLASDGRAATRTRTTDLYLQRPRMQSPRGVTQPLVTAYPAPSVAPCAPVGYRLVGWNTRGDGAGPTVTPGTTFAPVMGADENEVRLFAVWERIPRGALTGS